MHITELEESLPHGFHDAWIHSIAVDYVSRAVKFSMELWVGFEEQPPSVPGRTIILRPGQLTVSGLELLVIPQPSVFPRGGLSELDVVGNLGAPDDVKLPTLRPGTFVYSFYVGDWANSIVFAGEDAEFQWTGPAAVPP